MGKEQQAAEKRKTSRTFLILKKVWKNIPYLFFIFLEYFFLKVYKIQSYGNNYNVRKINQKTKERLKWKLEQYLFQNGVGNKQI